MPSPRPATGQTDQTAGPPKKAASPLAVGLKVVGFVLGVLSLVALFSLGLGVDRYVRWLARAMQVYASILDVSVGWLFDLVVGAVADWLVSMLGRYVEVGPAWKHVFTIISLYAFADSAQFFGRRDAPVQDRGAPRRLRVRREWRVGLVSVGAGFTLGLAAAVIVGLTPLDRSLGSGLITIGAAVGAIFLYWLALALAHARWNRWNFAQRVTPMEPVEPFGQAFRKRAAYAVRRSLIGAGIGVGIFMIVRTVSPAPAPGLITLGALAFLLSGFWIYRAFQGPAGRPLRQRWADARRNHNYGMGCDIAVRVIAAALLAAVNASEISI